MILKLDIPKFYKNKFGSEEEVTNILNIISKGIIHKKYSLKIDQIDFIPIILPQAFIDEGLGEEFTKFDWGIHTLAAGKRINFESFQSTDVRGKVLLILRIFFECLFETKLKSKLDVDMLIKDVEELLGYSIDKNSDTIFM